MGITTTAQKILTPPLAACHWLAANAPGRAAFFVPPGTMEDLATIATAVEGDIPAAVVVGDLSRDWTYGKLNRAFRLLMAEPKPVLVALGMTRYWRTPDGLSLDVGPFVKALEYAADCQAVVLGKPAAEFYATALGQLGCAAADTIMIGDDIVGDIQGAQRAGIQGVLVCTGKFRPQDLQRDIQPQAVLPSIADLPAWLTDQAER